MIVAGIVYCDRCHFVAFPDDYTAVKIEREGHTHVFQLHNRSSSDCLAEEILELKKRFTAPANN